MEGKKDGKSGFNTSEVLSTEEAKNKIKQKQEKFYLELLYFILFQANDSK